MIYAGPNSLRISEHSAVVRRHGVGVDPEAVKNNDNIEITHVNLNDDSIEGIRVKNKKAFSVQYHPEATPGPHESRYLFDDFISLITTP